MFHPSVKRLIWKEFRSQWRIWLSLMVGTFLLQVLFLVKSAPFTTIRAFPFYVATVLTYCFAATCGALLFAEERESSTDRFLQTLPASTSHLALGKLLFAFLSVVSFGAVAFAFGQLVWSLDSTPQTIRGFMKWEDHLVNYIPGVLGCLLWSLLLSLLLSHVMVVIVCGVLCEFLVTGIIMNPLAEYTGTVIVVRYCFYLILAAIDLWLIGRWLQNEPLRLPWQTRISKSSTQTGKSIGLSLAVVRWASSRRTLGMRTFAVLLWRELKSAVPFLLWWGLLGVLMVDLAPRFGLFPGQFVYLLATPVVCGLMTCLGDQQQQTHRFLGERGLNRTAVWSSKHVIWLPMTVALILVFGLYDAALGTRLVERGIRDETLSVAQSLNASFSSMNLLRFPNDLSGWGLQGAFVVWATLLLYAVGHLCALWFRRSVVAITIAGLMSVLFISWLYAKIYYDVPLLVACGPLLLAMMAGTWTTVSAWLVDDRSWRRLSQKVAWVILPVITCVLGSAVYRAEQVPDVGPGFDWHALLKSTTTNPEKIRLLDQQELEVSEKIANFWSLKRALDAEQYAKESAGAGKERGAGEPIPVPVNPDPVTDEQRDVAIDKLVTAADNFAENIEETRRPNQKVAPWDLSDRSIRLLGNSLRMAANFASEASRLSASWQLLRDGLVIESAKARSTTDISVWWEALGIHNLLLIEVTRWATADRQSSDQLQQAIDWFREHPHNPPRLVDLIKNQYVEQRQLLEGTLPDWDSEIQKRPFGPELYTSPLYATERRRTLKLLGALTQAHLAELDTSSQPPPPTISQQNLTRWVHTTPTTAGGNYVAQVELGINRDKTAQKLSQTIWNGTQVVLRLQQYQIEEGQFPERLDQLPGDLTSDLIRDPLSVGNFGYAPEGLPQAVRTSYNEIFPAGQPLLWSTCLQEGSVVKKSYLDSYAGSISSDLMSQIPTDALNVRPIEPNQIRFIILGGESTE